MLTFGTVAPATSTFSHQFESSGLSHAPFASNRSCGILNKATHL